MSYLQDYQYWCFWLAAVSRSQCLGPCYQYYWNTSTVLTAQQEHLTIRWSILQWEETIYEFVYDCYHIKIKGWKPGNRILYMVVMSMHLETQQKANSLVIFQLPLEAVYKQNILWRLTSFSAVSLWKLCLKIWFKNMIIVIHFVS